MSHAVVTQLVLMWQMDAYLESVAISVDNPAILLERNEDNLLRVVAAANAASGIVVPA
ncbi:hypothetical protein PC116_g5789 [Phytophthora cactorum]|uniref:Uncharacterized protein n=2 Tax=Phytophthora cactorum TaxID=29920 RepID=A0A8T1G4F9_9STRA|nr:hypothetical protein Pcac1_g16253 [Phytophthora cactorum]KAG2836855.1 hypothetical protein PC112_g5146 [Phytophthora cactorum]KAG2985973.1 hypothetical protein PC118_g8047 [Phytophthora cactorum]KAG3056079.1 hypothetical protein PC121_g15457 [Phytophthora cactorum]KAG3088939.1 hypothetical protein PC122_g8142 [Phytophthora cactorum]